MDGVPYPQPLPRPEPQYVPWGVLQVRPIGHSPGRCHLRPLTKGPGRIPPYCVCSGGAHTVTGGEGQTPEVGALACVFFRLLSSRPLPPLCWVRRRVFRHSWLGCGGGGGGGRLLATPGRGACVRVPATPGWGSLPVVAGGPSPLLAEDFWCGSPPLLAGVRWWCWRGGPSPLLAEVRWCVGRGGGGWPLATPG